MTDIKNPAGQETQVLTAAPNSESTGDTNLKEKETLQEYSGHDAGDADYNHASQGVRFSVLGLAVVLTLGFSAVELIGGLWANSLALVGDAGHMVTDSASLLFALVANIISRKGVDYNHSFGHGRIEVLAAFVNGIAMLGVVVWIFVEALERIQNPPPIAGGSVMIVAVIGLLINIAVAWSLSRDQKNVNTRAAFVHVLGDLLGSVAAITSGALIYFGGDRFALADPILSFVVCFLVLHATWGVFKDTTRVLTDAVPEGVNYQDVGDALMSVKGVVEVHDLHVWTMAPDHSAVMAHLHLEPNCDWPLALTEARALIRERFAIDHITLQPENADMERQCRWRPKDGCRFCCSRPEKTDCPHQCAA